MEKPLITPLTSAFQRFIRLEAFGGILLLLMLFIALIAANSDLHSAYQALIDLPIQIRIGALDLNKPAYLWVNEGLMAVFFLMLSLEIKREFLVGELSERSQLVLPFLGALGGITCPALVYYFINAHSPETIQGWPIPTTTDIAFMLGIVVLLGKRVPSSLKALLVAISIIDDIVAIAIIAFFYTANLSYINLLCAGVGVIALIICNITGVKRIAPYILIGIVIWVCVLKSGVHATLAGVLVAFAIPLEGKDAHHTSPLKSLENNLHPWVVFFIMPVFVLVNGGVPFTGFNLSTLLSPVPLGVGLGLFLGKAIGVFLGTAVVIRFGSVNMPNQGNYLKLFGIAALTGIGFTMSLFLTALAFNQTIYEDLARQGVLLGSLCSCILGVIVLCLANRNQHFN